jgi:4-hydroxybenzoate decarboxylase subunit C
MQRFSQDEAGLHWQIGRGGACHYHASEKKNLPLPVTVYLGGPPALILSAIAPLPENISELLLASFLVDNRLDQVSVSCSHHRLISECDLALVGYAQPHQRRLEGPFGDHYGYQDPTCTFPVFHCTKMLYRNDAIIPATVVGKPLQEDAYIGEFLQELMLPFLKLMIPNVNDLYTYPETGFHPLCAVRVEERYEREALSTAFRLLGEGQLSLTKVLLILKEGPPLNDIKAVLFHLLTHLRPEDIYLIPNTSTDTLDPAAPYRNKGSKIIFLGTSAKPRLLPNTPPKQCQYIKNASVFTPGCLVIDGPKYMDLPNPEVLTTCVELKEWPLIFLVDDAIECCSSTTAFLWNAFTRFNPSTNIHSSATKNNFSFPLLIDARIKPSYQKPLLVDPKTKTKVDSRFHEYFP